METVKYVIKYKLSDERRFDFAQLENGTEEEARQALKKIHGDSEVFTDIKVSKAL
ncbi:hypothetical protein NTD86_20860 [Pseudomonas sp. 7P_10.2_Bac1]|uniref:hypothetical protein n=1 Tax=Pseudomonas sp. 7P_10.2_Bac1 TaxID=2971614 RepID=UPI0021C8DCD7|nr:hypothetical protein [Pseudomonas sp. 7P_10.2_Bac1]MCU1729429.1 hypothetical protein [Pseudomonas sp. 7P_10.2_Bac1]